MNATINRAVHDEHLHFKFDFVLKSSQKIYLSFKLNFFSSCFDSPRGFLSPTLKKEKHMELHSHYEPATESSLIQPASPPPCSARYTEENTQNHPNKKNNKGSEAVDHASRCFSIQSNSIQPKIQSNQLTIFRRKEEVKKENISSIKLFRSAISLDNILSFFLLFFFLFSPVMTITITITITVNILFQAVGTQHKTNIPLAKKHHSHIHQLCVWIRARHSFLFFPQLSTNEEQVSSVSKFSKVGLQVLYVQYV